MDGRALDDEVAGRLVGAYDLRPYPGIARLQGAIGQARPIAADRLVEPLAAAGLDPVVDAVDPLDVGPELRLTAKIEGEVNAEPGLLGRRIDQMSEGRGRRG